MKLDKKKIKVVKEIGKLPPFEWPEKDGSAVYLRFDAPMRRITIDKKPATRCVVTDLETGSAHSLLAQTVLESTLEENYPANGYVGKSFELIRTKNPAKEYFEFGVKQIELTA